jgi:hypothetical protein
VVRLVNTATGIRREREAPVSDFPSGSAGRSDPDAELSTISYLAVGPGHPVVTHSGQQFAVVEHVLQIPELDLFDGIVVYTGAGLTAMNPKHQILGRAEMRLALRRGLLRFVDAEQVAAITPGYVKCTFEQSQVGLLPAPEGAVVLKVDMAREEQAELDLHARYGRMFGRPHWIRK